MLGPMTDTAAWHEGRRLFDAGAFWDCHEALEPAWLAADGTERRFLAGVILMAAALHKARAMGSPRGGRRNYAKALRHLALVPDRWAGVDVREFEGRVHRALREPDYAPRVPGPDPSGTRSTAKRFAGEGRP
jgi:predicted metal-dependent hydrolase